MDKGKIKYYPKFKGIINIAKETFLSDKGMEIDPDLEKLQELKKALLKLLQELATIKDEK